MSVETGVLGLGETCDGDCPTSDADCDASQSVCQTIEFIGDASMCTAEVRQRADHFVCQR